MGVRIVRQDRQQSLQDLELDVYALIRYARKGMQYSRQ